MYLYVRGVSRENPVQDTAQVNIKVYDVLPTKDKPVGERTNFSVDVPIAEAEQWKTVVGNFLTISATDFKP